jgi:transglutaminase-like putative cysteine protease
LLLLASSLTAGGPLEPDRRKPRRVRFTVRFTVKTAGKSGPFELICLVPQTIPGRQEVLSLRCSPAEAGVRFFTENGDRHARFSILEPAREFEIRIRVWAKLFPGDLRAAERSKKRGKRQSVPRSELACYLEAEPCVESDDPSIRALTRDIKAKTDTQKVRMVHDLVVRTLDPGPHRAADGGAVKALRARKGDCIDYADLFVALCRATGLPARHVEGYTIPYRGGPEYAWVEVNLNKHGWVYFDPMQVDLESVTFDRLAIRYVALARQRRKKAFDGTRYWRYEYGGESISIQCDVDVQKRKGG